MRLYKNLPISISKIFLAALLVSIFFLLQEFASHKIRGYTHVFSWFEIGTKLFWSNIVWAAMTPWIYQLSKTASFKTMGSGFKTSLSAVVLSFIQSLVALCFFALTYFVKDGLWLDLTSPDNLAALGVGSIASVVQLVFIVGAFMILDYYRLYVEKQKELNNAQLYALKMKLHPHFLFNTLHAISSMVDYNKEGAQKMLTRLGSLFRTILENEEQQTISLEEELKYIQDYLEIEQVRFEEQLEVEFKVSDDTLDASVPSLILQPLVENSIKHGVSKMKDRGKISIETKRSAVNGKDRVTLIISDNGQGFGKSTQKNFGIGIKNVNDRLTRLYNDDFLFEIGAGDVNGAIAQIEIPYLKKE